MVTFWRHLEQAWWYLVSTSVVVFYKIATGGLFSAILSKINRVPLISNINDCTKFGDNGWKQSGLRAGTSSKTE